MKIRQETAADGAAIRALLEESFPTDAESRLVERLRNEEDAVIALIAEVDGAVAAYAMFSRMTAPFQAVGLGPVATDGKARKKGLANALIREGLDRARVDGWDACFVLGNPRFYGRFGFRADLAAGFSCVYAGPSFMAIALQSAGLPVAKGRVAYAEAFGET
jgi:putative acetyltransferase